MRRVALFIALAAVAFAGAAPEATLLESYQKAHASRDIAALKKLFYPDRVSSEDHVLDDPRVYNLDQPITAITMTPTTKWPPGDDCDPSTFFVRDGVRCEFNLPVVACLHIEHGRNGSEDLPVGLKNGRYWIVSLVPAK